MKKTLLIGLVTILFTTITVNAQYGRNDLRDRAQRFSSSASELASRLGNDIRRGSVSRSDLDAAFLASQIESSARLFEQLVQDNKRESELRDAVSIISDLVRRAPGYGSQSYYWNDLKRAFDDVQRSIGGTSGNWGNNNNNNNDNYSKRAGSVRWRGKVDNELHLKIRNNTLDVSLFAGQDYGKGTYNFVSAMPSRNVNVYVNKKSGRGSVTIIQQPDRFNDYTAVIKILDDGGGARDYDVEVYWTLR